jgi:hypothetical protein
MYGALRRRWDTTISDSAYRYRWMRIAIGHGTLPAVWRQSLVTGRRGAVVRRVSSISKDKADLSILGDIPLVMLEILDCTFVSFC